MYRAESKEDKFIKDIYQQINCYMGVEGHNNNINYYTSVPAHETEIESLRR